MLSNSIDKYISENIGQNLDELKNRDLSAWMEYKSMNYSKLISQKYDLEDFYMYIKRAENTTILTDHYQVKEENDYSLHWLDFFFFYPMAIAS